MSCFRAVYWQQRSNLWDQELNERIHEHEKRFFVPNGTEFDPQVVKEALQQRPEQLGLFLRSGAAICSELPITTSQCEEGETVYLIEEQWLTDVTTWLIDDEPVSPPPSPTQYEGTDCPLLLGVDSTAFVVTSYQLAVLEAVFEFEDFDRQKLPQVQVSTGAGSKGGTAADLRPLSIWEVRLRTPDGLVTKRREVWVSTSLTMEQLRAQTKDWCCAGEKVDQTDYFGTLDWT